MSWDGAFMPGFRAGPIGGSVIHRASAPSPEPDPDPAWVATSTPAVLATGTQNVTPPGSASVGDLLVLVAFFDSGTDGTFDTYSGWTLQHGPGAGSFARCYILSRTHDGSGTYSVTTTSTVTCAYTITAFSDAVYDVDQEATATSNTPTAPDITTTGRSLQMACWATTTADPGASAPSGYTERGEYATGMNAQWHVSDAVSDAGATGTKASSTTYGSGRNWRAVHLAVKAA